MTFEEYLEQKKIDSTAFKDAEKSLWLEFENHFDQQHPKSFTAQKLFLINGIRRKYPLTRVEQSIVNPEKKVSRPVMKKRAIEEDASKTGSKPKSVIKAKPVIKKSASSNDNSKKPKPVMKRPKMK